MPEETGDDSSKVKHQRHFDSHLPGVYTDLMLVFSSVTDISASLLHLNQFKSLV